MKRVLISRQDADIERSVRLMRKIKIAFAVEGGKGWIAGIHYLQNLFKAIRSDEASEQYELHLVLPPKANLEDFQTLLQQSDAAIYREEPSDRYWKTNDRYRERFKNRTHPPELEPPLGRQLRRHGIDCIFGIESFGPRFRVPLISWLYDFQHKDLPANFSDDDKKLRDHLFGRVSRFSDRILVSSEHAKRVYCRHYPNRDRLRVVSFTSQLNEASYVADSRSVAALYQLPDRFFFLPNQFWKHKNHALAFEALAIAVNAMPDLQLVCSGALIEPRDAGYVPQLLRKISEGGLQSHVRILDMIPHEHVVQLMRQSIAVIQPSLYEGWSTTVEECKSLAKPILLSDICVHQEQAPEFGVYFNPHDPSELARELVRLWKAGTPGPNVNKEVAAQIANRERMKVFGRRFIDIVDEITTPAYVDRVSRRR